METNKFTTDLKSVEEQAKALVLMKILVLGSREIEQGKFRDVDEVFAGLEKTGR
ncbi:hypothetical protein ACO0LO_07050 [Undibacterium sp. TJN25]|uniref:hypothetical protein n=1 Tax=Undibacterium sp. TJN25 TaxID=3413056 RepID=UPI003BF3D49F